MQIIIGIVALLIFVGVAPRFFKWLLSINVIALVVYFIGLKIWGMFHGGYGKGKGSAPDALVDPLLAMAFAIPAIWGLGIVAGFLLHLFRKKPDKAGRQRP